MSGVGYEQLNGPLKSKISSGGGDGGSGGGSFIFIPQFNTVKLTTASNTVTTGFGNFNKDFDILLVFKNSVYMAPNEYYSVISNTQIQATGGETWVAGTVFQFVAFCVNRAPNALKTISIKNKLEITENANYINLGITDFNDEVDTLLLFENGVYMEKELDYLIEGTNVYPVGKSRFEASVEFPIVFNIIILRNVVDGGVLTEFNGANILNDSISKAKLDSELRNYIDGFNTKIGDLSLLKTNIKDNLVNSINEIKTNITNTDKNVGTLTTLKTTTKDNLVDSINELFQSANDGKTNLASVIGAPTNANNTFTEMKSNIQTCKDTLVTNLSSKGVTSVATDPLLTLVKAVTDIKQSSYDIELGKFTFKTIYDNITNTHERTSLPLKSKPQYAVFWTDDGEQFSLLEHSLVAAGTKDTIGYLRINDNNEIYIELDESQINDNIPVYAIIDFNYLIQW